MTDKQQIEKFATDLCKACSLKTCKNEYPPCVKAEWVSEALYNAGYRKVDENVVDMSGGELAGRLGIEWSEGYAQGRKETAKEIFQEIRNLLDATDQICSNPYSWEPEWGYCVKELEYRLKQLAKQYGVEVE